MFGDADPEYLLQETDVQTINFTIHKSLFLSIFGPVILGFCLLMIFMNMMIYFMIRIYVYLSEQLFYRGIISRLWKSKSYQEYIENCQILDSELGLLPENVFAANLLAKITNRLRVHRKSDQLDELVNVLKHSACRNNVAGIEHERCYSMSYYGSSPIIGDYVDEMIKSLDYVGESELPKKEKLQFFEHCFDSFGRTALCLSGGGTLAYIHFGTIKALLDQGCLPKIVTGSSAGCLAATLAGTRTDDELREILTVDLQKRLTACESSYFERLRRLIKTGAMFEYEDWRKKFDWWSMGNMTFLEAHERTGRILNICVTSQERSLGKVLNYITAPNVLIATAVIASAAIPGILLPVHLLEKTPNGIRYFDGIGSHWRDGSIVGDIPERELAQLFHVKYTIVGQCNPHIQPFFFNPRGSAGRPTLHRKGSGWRGGYLLASIVQYLRLDLQKWLGFIREMALLPLIFKLDMSNVFLQQFEGNVTITPPFPSIRDLLRVLTDPDMPRMQKFLDDGQLITWPKIHMIQNRFKIEKTLMEWRRRIRESSP